jgi:hypothetical protein
VLLVKLLRSATSAQGSVCELCSFFSFSTGTTAGPSWQSPTEWPGPRTDHQNKNAVQHIEPPSAVDFRYQG